jgi:hypothetical protein
MRLLSRSTAIRAALLVLAVSGAAIMLPAKPAAAADYSNNDMMDDVIFNDLGAMTPGNTAPTAAQLAPQIQAFLSGQSVALTNGMTTQLSGGSTCLATYQDTEPSWNGSAWQYGANVNASKIIADAAVQWGINPEVIISTLEKEESLIDGTSCDSWRYQSAMGYACPDSGGCSSEYAGFTRQVLWGSYQLEFNEQRSYGNTAWDGDGDITYTGYMTQGLRARCASCQAVEYDGNATIDGTSLYLDNGSTASLYSYTPHLNQSFPGIFEGWFGSTILIDAPITLSQGLQLSESTTGHLGDTVTGTYKVENIGNASIEAGDFGVCGRMNGQNFDFGLANNQSIAPNQTVTISYSRQLTTIGSLSVFICAYNQALGGWTNGNYPYDFTDSMARQASLTVLDNPLITTGVSLSPSTPAAGQLVTATMSIHNAGSSTATIGGMFVSGRDAAGDNMDFPMDPNVSIAAGATYTYSKSRTFPAPGAYSFTIVNWSGTAYTTNWPDSASTSIVRQVSTTVLNNPLITSGISLSPSDPAVGQPVTATMTVHNASATAVNIGLMAVAARDPNGSNVDFPGDANVSIPAGSDYTYSKTTTFVTPGNTSLFIANLLNGNWSGNYPLSASSAIVRQMSVNVLNNPLITSGITLTPSNPTVGQSVTATITIHNASASPVNVGLMAVAARGPNGSNVDFPGDANVTIPASSDYTYSKSTMFAASGRYTLFIANLRNGMWSSSYPLSANSSIIRQTSINL